ncbi:MAG: hypothetical protein U0525_03150 [Patescibacteria group bacterium]
MDTHPVEIKQKCQKCGQELEKLWFYCPNCGKSTQPTKLDTSIGKQLLIYVVSFCLAPFGLGWGFKYLFSKDKKAKVIGVISILLTVFAISLTIYATWQVMDTYSKMLDGLVKGKYPY